MATRIDDAKIRITLETGEAERQIDRLREQTVRGGTADAQSSGASTGQREWKKKVRDHVRKVLEEEAAIKDVLVDRKKRRDKVIGNYITDAETDPLKQVGGQLLSGNVLGAGRTLAKTAEESGVPVKGLAITALAYEAIKTMFTGGSTAIQSLKPLISDSIKSNEAFMMLERKAEEIAMGFNRWENQIKAIGTGAADAWQFTKQGAVLTGQYPAFGTYWMASMDINAQEANLQDKFNRFKTQELGRAMAIYGAKQVFGASAYE